MDIGASGQSCSHDLWPPLGLPHNSISHSFTIHSQPLSSSTRSCPESIPSFSGDDHVSFTGALEITRDHVSSVSCSSHQNTVLHSLHYLPHLLSFPWRKYTSFQPTSYLLPRFHLFVSSGAFLCISYLSRFFFS